MLKLNDLFVTYGDTAHAELAVFLDLLRSLGMIHHQHHWQATGSQAYGDHLLFQRLYEAIDLEIDQLGEKTVGLGGNPLVDSRHALVNMPRFINAVEEGLVISPDESPALAKVRRSLLAERSFITAGEKLMKMLESKGQLTRGVENLLGGILDTHETHVYLLEQRSKTT